MKLNLIVERDSRSYGFDYTNWKTDPRPNVLFLGSWVHPKTGNRLICACNMNYLNSEQMNRLQTFLPQIFAAGSGTKKRVNDLEALAPDIFDIAYRTYDIKYVAGISKGRIPHITLSPQGVEYEKEKAAEMGIPEPALEPTPEPEAVAPAPPPAPAPAEPSPVPAPAPEAPPAPQTPPAAQKPEEEPEEKPVKKEPEVSEPGAPPEIGFKPTSVQQRKQHGIDIKSPTPVIPQHKPTSVQTRKAGFGKVLDWLKRGASKVGSFAGSLFKKRN